MEAICCGNFIQVMQFRQSILWTDSGGFCVAMLPLSTPSLHLLHHWSSISEQNPTNLSPTSLFSRPALELKSNKDQIIRTVTQESGLVWTQFEWIIQACNDCKTSWKTHIEEAKEKRIDQVTRTPIFTNKRGVPSKCSIEVLRWILLSN